MDDNAKELFEREKKAFDAKLNLDSLNQEIALNFYPERADFTVERSLGEEFALDLFDGEPLRCRRDLGNARQAMLRPDGQEWVRAETNDPEINELPNVSKFLDWMNKRFRTRLYRSDSGFTDCEKVADMDHVTFGYAIKTAEAEKNRDRQEILLTRPWHPRDCAFFDDVTGIRQDTMFRRFKSSARHIKRRFPKADLADTIKHAIEKKDDKEFDFCHVMMPADEYDYYEKPARGLRKDNKWVSVYYDSAHKRLLSERPSKRFRYVVDRWHRIPGSQYGYSPAAMSTLPDARGIQTMARVLLEAGEKSVDPPKIAVRNAIIGEINDYASGITWVDGERYNEKLGMALTPLQTNDRNIAIGIDLINRTTFALRDGWYLTKLNLPTSPAKTAYETSILVQEFIRANTPLFGSWQAGESMMLEEIFYVMLDQGVFSMHPTNPVGFPFEGWPQELFQPYSDGEIIFNFTNALTDAIERDKANKLTQMLGLGAGVAEIDPNAPKRIDWGEAYVDASRGLGAPADWIKDEAAMEAQAQEDAAQAQVGDILTGLAGAEQAANVVSTGADAAAKLSGAGLLGPQAADESMVFGPV